MGWGYDIVIDIKNVVPNDEYSQKTNYVYSIEFYSNNKKAPAVTVKAKSLSSVNLASASDTIIHENNEKSTEPEAKSFDKSRHALSDAEYMELAKDPEENKEKLQKMVEEAAKAAGFTEMMYHGSRKSADINVFKDWQYFTENEQYAKRYAEKKLYTAYVKVDKWFDTRNSKCRKLFEKARQEYGMNEILKSGLPDWTDGYDISDYIDENELGYDGIVLDEGGDMVDGKPVSRGNSYVIKKSSQIKSADPITYDDNGKVIPLSKRFNIENDDIRYALPYDYDELIKKPDMQVTGLTGTVPLFDSGKINRNLVRTLALANGRKQKNRLNTDDFVYAHCNDTNTDIHVGTSGLNHGMDRRVEINAKAALIIGDLIKNGVKINEAVDTGMSTGNDYILLSAFQYSEGQYAVSIFVDRTSDIVNEFDSVDIMYSANGKKIGTAAPNARVSGKSLSLTVPTISIVQLLEKCNKHFKDIFFK